MMRKFWKFCFLILAAALLLALAPLSATEASAEDYNIGIDVQVTLTYGDAPVSGVMRIGDSNKFYKIASYLGSTAIGGEESPLLGGDGRVSAAPGSYYMNARGKVNGTDEEGNVLPGVECEGRILFVIQQKSLQLNVASDKLGKVYGDEIDSLPYTYRNPEDEDSSLTIVLTSAGMDPTAAVGSSYAVSMLSATKNSEDVTAYYDVTVFEAGSTNAANVTVSKKPVAFVYDTVLEVEFNDFLLDDGVSVLSMNKTGANGDVVTLFFRLTEAQTLLSIGEFYEIEPYKYVVTPSVGEPVTYALTDESNYDVSADLSSASSVKAKIGSVTLFQDESKIEARASDPSYVYLDPSKLTLTYLDDALTNFSGTVTFSGLVLYPNVLIDLTCSIVCGETNVPAGEYALTYVSFSSDSVRSVSAEDLTLIVQKRVAGSFTELVEREYGLEGNLVLELDRECKGETYSFELTAPTEGLAVGSLTPFTAMTSLTDENVILSYSSAIVRIVKRSTDVSIVAKNGLDRVVYGEAIDPCGIYVNYGKTGETLLGETLVYSHKKAGETLSRSGVPSQVGSYVVTCSLQSDSYDAEELVFDMTVIKRPVAAYYEITSAKKTYGETFLFSTNTVQLIALYYYDVELGEEDRGKNGLAAGSELGSALGGTGVSSAGGLKDAAVGSYPFDTSGIVSPIYDVKKVIMLDISTKDEAHGNPGEEVTVFTVQKAQRPGAVTAIYEISGRAAVISAKGGETSLQAQLSEKSDFSSPQASSGTNSAKFPNLRYGVTYFVRLRVSDPINYREEDGDWSETISFAIAFPKPTVKLQSATSTSLTFSADALSAASGRYVFQYKVGDGDWEEGLEVKGLSPDTPYTVRFRAYNKAAAGQESSLTERTLRGPVSEKKVNLSFDEKSGVLKAESALSLEYRLLDEDDIVLEDWSDECEFSDIKKDGNYTLEVREPARNGKAASETLRIAVDTSPVKKVVSGGFLSQWFIFVVGGAALVLLVIFIIVFAKVKKSVDETELGG